MKLAILANAYSGAADQVSGGLVVAIEVAKRWSCDNVEVIWYSPSNGLETIRNCGGCEAHVLHPSSLRFLGSDRFPVVLAYMIHTAVLCLRMLFQRNLDLLYLQSHFLPNALPAALHKLTHPRTRLVVVIHHLIPPPQIRPGNRLTNALSYYAQQVSLFILKRFTDAVLTSNPILVTELGQILNCQARWFTNGVNHKVIAATSPLGEHYEGIYLGRLHPSKGIFDLVDVWSAVTRQIPQARLAVIGAASDPKTLQELMRRIEAAGLTESILIQGFQEHHYAWLKSADVFVFPSHEEGWGIVIAEALACGLPVVAYNLPVYQPLFGSHICQVSLGDCQAMAHQIVYLLKHASKRVALADDGREFAKARFVWDAVAYEEIAFLREL